jgi:hypothetical protein
MRRATLAAIVLVILLGASTLVAAQTRRPPARRPAPPPPPAKTVTATPEISCPAPLGVGVKTKLMFCDVMSGRDPAEGMIIKFPSHQGPVTLTFDLHNRHTYSEEQIRANRAFARYTATIGALTADNTLIARAVIQNEFRKASDLVDRVGGGAGPGGLKAVAPTGTEHITMTIPDGEEQVSLLGEKLTIDRPDGNATYTSPGRPIAVISNVAIEYTEPLPARAGKAGRAGGAGRAGR